MNKSSQVYGNVTPGMRVWHNSKSHLPVDSAVSVLRISPKDTLTKLQARYIHGVIYYSTICSSTKLETIHMSIIRELIKWAKIHNGA